MKITQLLFGLVFWASAFVWPAALAAEPLYFVSLAKIKPGAQQRYEGFLVEVAPIWKRNNMDVLLRLAVDPKKRARINELDIDEIAVLKVLSRADFRNYINDSGYRKISADRLSSVDFFYGNPSR